jgi:hypothetical protein
LKVNCSKVALDIISLSNGNPVNLTVTEQTTFKLYTGNGAAIVTFRVTSISGLSSEYYPLIVGTAVGGKSTQPGWIDVTIDVGDTLSLLQSTVPSVGFPVYRMKG